MYNWSVDEKQFKNANDMICFLKNQQEVISVQCFNREDKFGNQIIRARLSPHIHPARKFYIAHYLLERIGGLKVSVYER